MESSKKPSGIVYKITNKINGKIYIGQTIRSISVRWARHILDAKGGSPCHFHRAIQKYGAQSFVVDVICSTTEIDTLGDLERLWIKKLNSLSPNGYNMTEGGDGGLPGFEHTEETKALMSAKAMGRPQSEETKAKLSAFNKGNKNALGHSPSAEAKEKMALANIGRVLSEEHRAKISAAGKGKTRSAETRARIAAGKIGNKNGAGNKGLKRSEEAVANITAASLKRYSDPTKGKAYGERSEESKKRMSEAAKNRKRVYTDEERAIIGEKTKARWAARKAAAAKVPTE